MACAVVHRAVTHSLARSAVTPLRDIGPSVAAALNRKGCALYACGEMQAAVEVLEEYLSHVSQTADRRVFISKNFDESRREEVDACCILGRACQAMGDMRSASESLKRALALSHESGDRTGEAKCLIAFGEFYANLWDTSVAKDHVERALSICIQLQDKAGEVLVAGGGTP